MLFGDSLLTQRMLNHQSDWGKGRMVQGRRMAATPGYIVTLTDKVRSHVETYSNTIQELAGYKPMSAQTKAIFLEGRALTIYERHALLLEAGTPEILKAA
jgi:hypothetical protein